MSNTITLRSSNGYMEDFSENSPLDNEVSYHVENVPSNPNPLMHIMQNRISKVLLGFIVLIFVSGIIIINYPTLRNILFPYSGKILFLANPHHIYALKANTGEILWQHDFQGTPNRKPFAIIANQLILENGKNIEALNTRTGLTQWTYHPSIGIHAQITTGQDQNSKFIYISLITDSQSHGSIVALDPQNGNLVWHDNMPHGIVTAIVDMHDQVAVGEQVASNSIKPTLTLLNTQSGKLIWQTTIEGVTTVIPRSYNSTSVYISGDLKSLFQIQRLSGDVGWQIDIEQYTDINISFLYNSLVISTPNNPVRPSPYPLSTVQVINSSDGQLQWSDNILNLASDSAFIANNQSIVVYLRDNAKVIVEAINAKDGQIIWKSISIPGKNINKVSQNNNYIVFDEENTLFSLNSVDGSLFWSKSLPFIGSRFASVISNSTIFEIRDGKLFSIELINGAYNYAIQISLDNTDGIWMEAF